MDLTRAQEILDSDFKPIAAALGLQDWTLHVYWKHFDDAHARCKAMPAQKMAMIDVDHCGHKTVTDLRETFIHELLHCVHSHTALLRNGVRQHLTEQCWETYEDLHTFAVECIVRSMEEMLMSLGMTPARLIARGKRLLDY